LHPHQCCCHCLLLQALPYAACCAAVFPTTLQLPFPLLLLASYQLIVPSCFCCCFSHCYPVYASAAGALLLLPFHCMMILPCCHCCHHNDCQLMVASIFRKLALVVATMLLLLLSPPLPLAACIHCVSNILVGCNCTCHCMPDACNINVIVRAAS